MPMSLVRWMAAVRFARDARGVTGSEYALVAALIAMVIIAGLSLSGTSLEDLWTGIGDCMAAPAADCM